MRAIQLIFVGLFILWNNLALAGTSWAQNTQLLPQYCKDRAKGWQSPEFQRWKATFGDVFIHIHHYCGGLYEEQKARIATNPQQRKHLLDIVISVMQGVGKHCDSGCVLFPELHCRLGWALGESGRVAEAIEQFNLVIKARPEYAPAYSQLSDLYVKIKMPDEARKVLEAGLKAKPGSHMLQRRLEKL